MAPVALVIARARVLIEIAILTARSVVLAGDAAVVRIFGVVARTGAFGIGRVDQPIAVVVHTVAAFVDFALASALLAALRGTGRATRAHAARRGHLAARARTHTRACARGVIATDFDILSAAECREACEPAENDGPCSELPHGSRRYHLGVASSTMRWCAEPGNDLENPLAR